MNRTGYTRAEVTGRTLSAVLGGYALAWCFTAGVSRALPLAFGMRASDAVMTASMLSFVVYLVAIVRVFALRSAVRAAAETWGIAGLLALAAWALPAPSAPSLQPPAFGASR